MQKKPKLSPDVVALRRRAEERLKTSATEGGGRTTEVDSQRLIHELQVHQIELEMQNEELRASRTEVEESAERYTDLYDFAPVGYFTLNRNGAITQTNPAGAYLLDLELAQLKGKQFGAFVAEADRPAFNTFFGLVFATPHKSFCEVSLNGKEPARIIRIKASLSADEEECFAVAVDITACKLAEERIRRLVLHLETAREDERRQISHDLNENIGQILAALKIDLSLAHDASTSIATIKQNEDMQSLVNDCFRDIRSLCQQLHPGALDVLSLNGILTDLVDHWQYRNNIECKIEADFPDQELPEQVKTTVFRILEEALTNVSRHARASKVEIRLRGDNRFLFFSIADNGCGMEMTSPQKPESFGLLAIHERVKALHGTLWIESAPDAGMKIECTIPLQQKSDTVRRKKSGS